MQTFRTHTDEYGGPFLRPNSFNISLKALSVSHTEDTNVQQICAAE